MRIFRDLIRRIYCSIFALIGGVKEFRYYWRNKAWFVSYFPGEKKSKIVIFFDLLLWLIKNREFNKFYFSYGLNIKNSNMNMFCSYREFREKRDSKNQKKVSQKGTTFNYLALTRDKFVFSQYLNSLKIPTVNNKFIFKNERFMSFETGQYMTCTEFFDNVKGQFFCKEMSGEGGQEAFSLTLNKNRIIIDGKESTKDEVIKKIGEDFLVQELIQQHDKVNAIHSKSVNTVRIVTSKRKDGTIFVSNAQFRCGANGSTIDNWWAGGMIVGINLDNGQLSEYGFYKPGYGTKAKIHPNSKIKFENYQLPYWEEVMEQVINAHQFFYGLFSIGWDVAITNEGPILIEANEDWEVSMPQAVGQLNRNDVIEVLCPSK